MQTRLNTNRETDVRQILEKEKNKKKNKMHRMNYLFLIIWCIHTRFICSVIYN